MIFRPKVYDQLSQFLGPQISKENIIPSSSGSQNLVWCQFQHAIKQIMNYNINI